MYDDNSTGKRGFDEETGKTITATVCPRCAGMMQTEGGEIACLGCETVLNEYARTGRLLRRSTDENHSRAEVA